MVVGLPLLLVRGPLEGVRGAAARVRVERLRAAAHLLPALADGDGRDLEMGAGLHLRVGQSQYIRLDKVLLGFRAISYIEVTADVITAYDGSSLGFSFRRRRGYGRFGQSR